MHCTKCHSPRIIKFIDGFGEPRVFCRDCQESIPLQEVIQVNMFEQALKEQKRLPEFTDYYRDLVRI